MKSFLLNTLLLILLLSSCKKESHKNVPDISHIQLDLSIDRFEKDVFALDTNNLKIEVEKLLVKYPEFFPFYVEDLMQISRSLKDSVKLRSDLKKFITNEDMIGLKDKVIEHYPELTGIGEEIELGFRFYQHYFPNKRTPRVISTIAGIGPPAFTVDQEIIGISLDMYLGAEEEMYKRPDLPAYMSKRFEKEYIPINAMMVWLWGLYPDQGQYHRLIDQMFYTGKFLYALDLFFPEKMDRLKIGYTQDQFEWCVEHENDIWSYFVSENLLYESDHKKNIKYIQEAPTSKGMPPESPGKTGAWMGWQMVRTLMNNQPNMTLEELFKETDGQKLLNLSRYKPKRN